jgi:glutathione S-transferase/RNA polymerase-associated protein
MAIVLYDHPLSPYAQKVKIALREKNLPFSAPMPTDLGSGRTAAAFARANPRAEVPALIHDGACIWDSTIILEYLEDAFPAPPLRPSAPMARAQARMVEDAMDTHFEAITWALSEIRNFGRATGAEAERLTRRAGDEVRAWHVWLQGQLGTGDWFNGSTFGWADLAVVPFLNGAAGFGCAPAPDSALGRWFARANARPSVATTRAEAATVAMDATGPTLEVVRAAIDAGAFKREYRDHRLEWLIRNGAIEIVSRGLERNNIRFTEPFKVAE